MKTKHPINLNLFSIRFPITAIISILHRITGVILFLFIPYWLWLLAVSLADNSGFAAATSLLATPLHAGFMWLGLSAFAYHLIAGLRHLLMDFGYGESLPAAKLLSVITLGLTIIVVFFLGVCLW